LDVLRIEVLQSAHHFPVLAFLAMDASNAAQLLGVLILLPAFVPFVCVGVPKIAELNHTLHKLHCTYW
jgi:hypothetical protein